MYDVSPSNKLFIHSVLVNRYLGLHDLAVLGVPVIKNL